MWASLATDMLWRNAVAVVPLALLVALACRFLPCRPATRHGLWLMVLLWLVLAPVIPSLELPVQSRLASRLADEPAILFPAPGLATLPAPDGDRGNVKTLDQFYYKLERS